MGAPELAIPEEIANRLEPYAGRPIDVHASRLGGHPTGGPSKASVREVKSIRELPRVALVRIEWGEPDAADSVVMRQVRQAERVEIKLTLTSRSPEPLALEPSPLVLILHRVRPSESGKRDPLAYWSGFRAAGFKLVPDSPTVNIVKDHHRRWRPTRPEHPNMLRPGESRSWTFTLTNIPPNEYEVAAGFDDHDKATGRYVRVLSNWLRLDVLSDEAKPWQGLQATLDRDEDHQPAQAGEFPMRVRFKNTGDKPLRFNLRKYRGHWVVSDDMLVCYDERGTLLPIETPGGPVPPFFASLTDPQTSIENVRLESGKDLVIPIELPPGTRTARVAFQHRFDLTGRTAPDEIAFDGLAYVFSPHVRLEPRKPDGDAKPGAGPSAGEPVEDAGARR